MNSMAHVDNRLALDQACRSLTDEQRQMLWLRYYKDQSLAEIASTMRISSGKAVHNRISRILKRLRSKLQDAHSQEFFSNHEVSNIPTDLVDTARVSAWISSGDAGWHNPEDVPHAPIKSMRIEDL